MLPTFNRLFLLVFSLILAACSVQSPAPADFDKQQAAKARVELGLGYLNRQNPTQAKLNFDKALSYAPDYYLVHAALAYYYQRQGDVAQAERAYLSAIKADKKQGDVYNNYGTFLCSQGKFEQAYTQFQHALNTPDYYHQADTYENIALCALSENNTALYRQYLALLGKLSPARAEALQALSGPTPPR